MSNTVLEPFRNVNNVRARFVLPPYLEVNELVPGAWPTARTQLRGLYQWNEDHLVVGFIAATIYPIKGQMHFIDAMLPVAAEHPKARFLIVGSQVDEGHYLACRMKVLGAGFEDRFVFHPFAEHVSQVYPAMDIVVVPSLMTEGFGMTALEGMAFGKAVVAFASGGLAEILSATGNERFLVPKGDVSGLTDRMRSLVNDESYRFAVASRNIDASMQAFGIESFRHRLSELMGMIGSIPRNRPPVPIVIDIPLAKALPRRRIHAAGKGRRRRNFRGKRARLRRLRRSYRISKRTRVIRRKRTVSRVRPRRRLVRRTRISRRRARK